jgi:hypothetical protein
MADLNLARKLLNKLRHVGITLDGIVSQARFNCS